MNRKGRRTRKYIKGKKTKTERVSKQESKKGKQEIKGK